MAGTGGIPWRGRATAGSADWREECSFSFSFYLFVCFFLLGSYFRYLEIN